MEILGPELFSEMRPLFEEEAGPGRCRCEAGIFGRSALRLACRTCIARERCGGLGRREANLLPWREYRSTHADRRRGREALFHTDDPELMERYRRFVRHVDGSDLRYADRYLYFVRSLDYGSPYVQTDRFVYHCDYLPRREYGAELAFLASQTARRSMIADLESLALSGGIARYAYSRGRGKGGERESFYFAPPTPEEHDLLAYFAVPWEYDARERLVGLGIDYYDGRLAGYKLYSEIRPDALWRRFPEYLERIGIDPLGLHTPFHYHVLRFDREGRKLSERIDLIYDPRDREAYRSQFAAFPSDAGFWERIHIFGLAYDFAGERLEKVNLYYRNPYQ
jgi:hypothetical protein